MDNLQPHQRIVIDKKVTKEHGVLLYHHVGTGKTLTALGIYKYYCSKITKFSAVCPLLKLLIVCPSYIVPVWKQAIKETGIPVDLVKIVGFNYQLSKLKLEGYIVIVDEAHNWIPRFEREPEFFNKTFATLNKAVYIVLSTATPVITGGYQISYLVNLAAGKKVLPYNDAEFREKYMKINKSKQLVYGRFLPALAVLSGMASAALPFPISSVPSMALALLSAGVSYNDLFQIDSDHFIKKTCRYISFYKNNAESEDYPKVSSCVKMVDYTAYQYNKYLGYLTEQYDPEIFVFLKDLEPGAINSDTLGLLANYNNPNLILQKLSVFGNLSEPGTAAPKFEAVYKELKGQTGVVVYSNFYNQGLCLFSKFLKGKKVEHSVLVKGSKFKKTLEQFKAGKIKVLLVHPELTEGYTIHGAQQLHILEPILDSSKNTQVTGRVVRYRSHAHLPKDKRLVKVFVWAISSDSIKQSVIGTVRYYRYYLEHFAKHIAPGMVPNRLAGVIESPDQLILKAGKNVGVMEAIIQSNCSV